jgi:hypothetical protein
LPIAGVAVSSLAIMLLASLVPAALVLRQRPVDLAALRE